jgi:hypothetical protein
LKKVKYPNFTDVEKILQGSFKMATSIFDSMTNATESNAETPPSSSSLLDFIIMSNNENDSHYEAELVKSQNILIDVTHAISLIIIEERRQLYELEVNSTKISHFLHSKLIIDKIISYNNNSNSSTNEINNSNIPKSLYSMKVAKTKMQEQQQEAATHTNRESCCCLSYYNYPKNKLPSNLKLRISDDINCNTVNNNNNDDEQLRQCQIASKLKIKIEKCILDHLVFKNQKEESFLRHYHHYQSFNTEQQQHQEFKPNSITNFTISQVLYNNNNTYNSNNNNNKIKSNIIIQVYLLPSCCFGEFISKQENGSNLVVFNENSQSNLDLSAYNSELLECWNISIITTSTSTTTTTITNKDTNNNETLLLNNNLAIKTTNSILTLNQLFQAIRSYLHFSQISSWISKTKEHSNKNNNSNNFSDQSKNIAFSIRYSNLEEAPTEKQEEQANDQKQTECNEFRFSPPTTLFPQRAASTATATATATAAAAATKSPNKRIASNDENDFDFQTFPQFSSTTHFNTHQTNQSTSLLSVNLQSRKRNSPILPNLESAICTKHNMAATTNPECNSNTPPMTPNAFKPNNTNNNNNKLSYSPPLTPTSPTSSSLLFSFQDDMKKSLQQQQQQQPDFPLATSDQTSSFNLLIRKSTKQVNIPINNNNNNLIKAATLPQNKSHSNFPLSSSPAPLRKSGTCLFDFDNSLKNPRSIKNALAVVNALNLNNGDTSSGEIELGHHHHRHNLMQLSNSSSNFGNGKNAAWPVTPSCLLGTFEESLLNGRMNPVGLVDGFYAEIGASGSFFPPHEILPVNASFYQVCEDIAASPYLGVLKLDSLGSKRGYKVPNRGTVQVTLFNPNNTVVKMFVVMYDLSDMPPNNRTFLRQRTMYVPSSLTASAKKSESEQSEQENSQLKSYLRYLIHLRFATTKSGKMYLHSDIKLIFARNKCEIDPRLACYEYKTLTEAPKNPKYSPKK